MDQFLREKLNTIEDLIRQEELAKFQQNIVVLHAQTKTGDAALDRQFEALANNAKTAIKGAEHRLKTLERQRALLQQELNGASDAAASE